MSASSAGDLSMSLPARRQGIKWLVAGVTAVVALTLDLLSKRWALSTLFPDERMELLPYLHLQRTSNTGVAFGLLSGRTTLIVAAAGVALLVMIGYILLEPRPLLGGVAGGLLLGGGLGNLVERVASGAVTDFIKLPNWPTFNLADVFLFAGVALVLAGLFLGGGHKEDREAGA